MGYLHHSRHWIYFEMGRTELLRRSGMTYRQCEAAGVRLVVVRGEIKYLAPALYDDVLVLTTRLKKMGRAKMVHAYELRRKSDGAVLARAETTLGCVNAGGTVIAIPDSLRRA